MAVGEVWWNDIDKVNHGEDLYCQVVGQQKLGNGH